jgi:CBS domain-containing protein
MRILIADGRERVMGTRVRALIGHKGDRVVTVAPDASVAEAVALLAHHGIGAVVVSEDGRTIAGVLSERDVVRHLAAEGASALNLAVERVMTTAVETCGWETTTDELVVLMTERRFRHVPVVEDGGLVAIVSIGDVVRARMDDLVAERDDLQAYVAGSY